MVNEQLRKELVGMRDEDRRVRQELLDSGQLGGPYVPRMEEVHQRNAARLRELIEQHGWPAENIAGKDGAEAVWFIAQHAIGEPEFQRQALRLLLACAAEGRTPRDGMQLIWKTELRCKRADRSALARSGSMIRGTVVIAPGSWLSLIA